MTLTDPEKLVCYVRSLPDFEHYQTIDGHYDHVGAIVADAILQANMKYATHVKPRVNRILDQYPETRTTSAVLSVLESTSASEFLKWKRSDRTERFTVVLELLAAEGVETEADLRQWLTHGSNFRKLRSIKGIGPKTIDYFQILVGISTSAIDRHLLRFLSDAAIVVSNYTEAQSIVNAAADILVVDRAHFDHSIWQYMSKKMTTTLVETCSRDSA